MRELEIDLRERNGDQGTNARNSRSMSTRPTLPNLTISDMYNTTALTIISRVVLKNARDSDPITFPFTAGCGSQNANLPTLIIISRVVLKNATGSESITFPFTAGCGFQM